VSPDLLSAEIIPVFFEKLNVDQILLLVPKCVDSVFGGVFG
jgi:hypothetical protein